MSKAEDKALEKYPYKEGYDVELPYPSTYDENKDQREAFIEGYHQAEKDFEQTWEDMMIIHKCIKDAMNYKLYKMMEGMEGQKEVYEEVLKRFKAQKGEKVWHRNVLQV